MKIDRKRLLLIASVLLVPLSANAATPRVAAGHLHTVALKNDGTLVAVGDDTYGQLGLGRLLQSTAPLQVLGLGQVRAIAAGGEHTFALKQDGTAWAWGWNGFGQLGDGTCTNRSTPVPVPDLAGATAVGAGHWHTLAVKQDGTVWAWGDNRTGQLGDGTYERRLEPVLLVNETFRAPLDLVPETPNSIPPDKIPPFFVATYRAGDLSATTLAVDVRGISSVGSLVSGVGVSPLAAGDYNVYVAASVPSGGLLYYYQLDSSNNWSVLTWPMADFIRGQALGSQDALIRVNILQNVDLRPFIGTSIPVGSGTSPDEMLARALSHHLHRHAADQSAITGWGGITCDDCALCA